MLGCGAFDRRTTQKKVLKLLPKREGEERRGKPGGLLHCPKTTIAQHSDTRPGRHD